MLGCRYDSAGPSGVPRRPPDLPRSGCPCWQRAVRTGRTGTVRDVAQPWLDEQQQRTWRAWLTVAELVPRVLDAQLQRDAGLTHAAYVVLAMLSEAPNRSRRMSDLARRA